MEASVTQQAFKEALSKFASGVTVVAARSPEVVGMTATAFASVSLDPPLVLVCVAKKSSVHDPLVGAAHFGVSVLASGQRDVSDQAARPGPDRFRDIPLDDGPHGAPLVSGAMVQLACARYATHDAGDHTVLIGLVVSVARGPGEPLLHFDRRYGRFDPAP